MSPTSFHCSTPRAASLEARGPFYYLKRPPRFASMLRLMSSRRSSLVFKNFESFSSKMGSAPSGSSRFPRPPRRYDRGRTGADIPAGPSGTAACFNERSIFPLVTSTLRTLTLTLSFILTWLLTSRTYSFGSSEWGTNPPPAPPLPQNPPPVLDFADPAAVMLRHWSPNRRTRRRARCGRRSHRRRRCRVTGLNDDINLLARSGEPRFASGLLHRGRRSTGSELRFGLLVRGRQLRVAVTQGLDLVIQPQVQHQLGSERPHSQIG